MVQFSTSSVFTGGLNGPLFGIADLDMALFGNQWKLFATNEIESTVSVFDVMGGSGPAVSGSAKAVTGGQFGATGLDIVSTGAGTFAVFGGDGNATHDAYKITVTGSIGNSTDLAPASGDASALSAISVASVAGVSVAATSQAGQSGFTIQSVDTDLLLTHIETIDVPGSDISDVEIISLGNTGLAIAIDRAGDKILSYTVAGDGTLTPVDTLGVADGLGLIAPEILRVVDVAGQSFGVVAAGSSSSISVFEIADTGDLTARDHVIDGQGTRFASISELEIVEAGGRAFILAAGVDDGLTLLELLPDGRMMHHATIEDSDATTLENISGLTGEVQNGVLHVFAASETEAGLTELTFDLGPAGLVQTGGTGDDTINGGAGNDVLFGGHGAGDDALFGYDGDDILVAGHGADRLIGGLGADVFVFGDSHDGGQVDDFNVNKDMLDLSGWFLLHDVSQLSFTSHGDRVDVGFQGYSVTLYSHNGGALNSDDVVDRITINPSHSMISDTPDAANLNDTHHGTAGDDVLFGNAGQDMFYAGTGADVYVGGDDFDVVTFENASARIKTDLLKAKNNRGEIADDKLYSIEGLEGTDFGDTLKGNRGNNWFDGGEGDDSLGGRNGRDELLGGAGDDTLKGNKGRDELDGGGGDDMLRGGGGSDTLTGGTGDDELIGGRGADEFHFVAGRDKIKDFDVGNDTLYIDDALLADPTMTASEVIDTYGRDTGRSVRLDFGPDGNGDSQMVILQGVRHLDDLADGLFIF